MRKFADKQTKNKEQSSGSNTEATLILCGYSGERANTIEKQENIYLRSFSIHRILVKHCSLFLEITDVEMFQY